MVMPMVETAETHRSRHYRPEDQGFRPCSRPFRGANCARTPPTLVRSESPRLALDEALQLLRAARVAELPQRLRLDLADALAGHVEVLADLFERVVALLTDA